MPDRDEKGDEMKDRLSSRFDTPAASEDDENQESGQSEQRAPNAQPEQSTESDQSNTNANTEKTSMRSKNNKKPYHAENIKEEWSSSLFYLPDEIASDLDNEFDRLRYEAGQRFDDWKPKKNRHYYPLVAEDGLDVVREMTPQELRERLLELELIESSEL